MRLTLLLLPFMLLPISGYARLVRDTVLTKQNDRIILTYDISHNGEDVALRVDNKPRIIPGDNLRKACKGDLGLLKVVIFDRVGDFGNVKWKGLSPTAFMVPSGFSYHGSNEGFYILGETTTPVSFTKKGPEKKDISFPLYLAVYEKKQTYRIVCSSANPLKVSVGKSQSAASRNMRATVETERIAIKSSEEIEADNEEITRALASMKLIRQLLDSESELPFSQTLQMEIYNLRSLKDRVNDPDVVDRINDVILLCNEREKELKEAQKDASLAEQAQQKALEAHRRAEEDKRQKEVEEKARVQEEKQQKRTLWMIIGAVLLAVVGFIGNAVFKHFRDIRNQKSIMEMQESLARQAAHEAGRRSREIVRNKTHQLVKKGESGLRNSVKASHTTNRNKRIKSI